MIRPQTKNSIYEAIVIKEFHLKDGASDGAKQLLNQLAAFAIVKTGIDSLESIPWNRFLGIDSL
jgi:hypothetical protein